MKHEKLYLQHISEAYKRIEEYSSLGKGEFFKNQMMQDAIIKVLANLTESAGNLSEQTKIEYADVPWGMVKSFRNMLVHDYLGDLDYEVVWKIISTDLPVLVNATKKILKEKYGI